MTVRIAPFEMDGVEKLTKTRSFHLLVQLDLEIKIQGPLA